ncbi:MAG TPA: hypothetical protein VMV44_03465 [Rectinemataceae bacterium]|nr:hypothetical protein [Rectinemataceae bacterium]
MAAPAFLAQLLDRLRPLLDKLPFLPKRERPVAEEPFQELEDHSPEPDESFVPNALPSKTAAARRRIDMTAVGKDLLSKPPFVAGLAALVLFCLALLVVSIIVNAAPPSQPAQAELRPPTPEGRAAASRLLLPPDPALDLSPPLEREPHIPYTDEDIRRLAPVLDAGAAAPIAGRNDRAMDALFGAVP